MNYHENIFPAPARITISDLLNRKDEEEKVEGIIAGLVSEQKHISSKYFYDRVGAGLFEEITRLPEYYLTRTEKDILRDESLRLAGGLRDIDVIELGSGDGSKISLLLDYVPVRQMGSVRYVPVDVNRETIEESAVSLIKDYPGLRIHGVVADFVKQLDLIPGGERRLVCFFGSTLGNLSRIETRRFMADLGRILPRGGMLLLGVDMAKDRDVLENAYNDSQRVTERFNRNILNVVNAIAGTDFEPDQFDHVAFYDEERSRIEMHLKARKDMAISSPSFDSAIRIRKGETIHTENSHKFTRTHIDDLASAGGLEIRDIFTDKKKWFSLIQFVK